MTPTSATKVSLFDYFGQGVKLYAENFTILFNFAFLCSAPPLFKGLLDKAGDGSLSLIGLVFTPVALCMYVFFWMCLIHTIASLSTGTPVTIKEAMACVARLFWRGLGGYLLFAVALVAGLMLLIVPGLYVMTVFYFFIFAILLEDNPVAGAFRRSHELVKGNFWRVLSAHGIVILLTLIVSVPLISGMKMLGAGDILAMIIVGVAAIIILPVFTAFYYFIYTELKAEKDGALKISVHS